METVKGVVMDDDDDDTQQYVTARERAFEHTFYQIVRNRTLEEVAREIEGMKAFGNDTIASFTLHIRNMKK